MTHAKAFLAGYISTIVFHQGVISLLFSAGMTASLPLSLQPVPPLGIPQVVSLAFWGGVWGVLLWPLVRHQEALGQWSRALLLGALCPSLVGWFLVMPLKGEAVAGGWNPHIVSVSLMANAVWGLGMALICQFLVGKPRVAPVVG